MVSFATLDGQPPLVIAHRGASGYRPEHTLEAYKLAIEMGVSVIEPDLVATRDGVLVARHEHTLSDTTNVAEMAEFADRRVTKTIGGREITDWFTEDFTLAELKTLRAVQAFPGRSKVFDGLYQVPTFDEILDLAKSRVTVASKPVCVYPEAKGAAYHAAHGFPDFGERILATLEKHGMATKGSPVFIQSFEPDFVQKMRGLTELPLVMLVADRAGYDAAMAKPGAPFWNGLGPNFGLLFDSAGKSTGIVEAAHAKGIVVHPWTFRDDAPVKGEDIETTMRKHLVLGIDGFFTDFPITGYKVRNEVKFAQ